jgi:uncharacterized phage protein (TIGR02220 family)
MAKDTFYFSHDFNARQDEKIKRLIRKYKMQGYGIFWSIVEDLYNNANALETDYEGIAFDYHSDVETITSIINDFDLFVIDGKTFGSISIERRLNERNAKSTKASESAHIRWQKHRENANALQTHSDSNAIKERKEKKGKELNEKKESKENEIEILTPAQEILIFLNETANRAFDFKNKNSYSDISARLKEGYTSDELKEIIQLKTMEWINDDKMRQYLTPATLFSAKNCNKYKEQVTQAKLNPQQFKNSINAKSNYPKTAYTNGTTPFDNWGK